jgi:hypothetical protein
MRHLFIVPTILAGGLLSGSAHAQVPLSSYADAKGYIDVQAFTCAQLAGTFQEDADALTLWYSGWYNGLAKKHLAHLDRARKMEHEVIVYCKQNTNKKKVSRRSLSCSRMSARNSASA